MQKRVIWFVCLALLILAIVPAVNLWSGNAFTAKKNKWWRRAALYNLDFALPPLNSFLYSRGISTVPNLTVIGRDGWLYLGDGFEETLSVTRRQATPMDVATAVQIDAASRAWARWLQLRSVRSYKIMIGPNTSSVYPEFLPDWVQPAADSVTKALLAQVSDQIYVDSQASLLKARSRYPVELYYKTDTHWNKLGAWIAFRAFSEQLAVADPALRILSDQDVRAAGITEWNQGGLARFLRMATRLADREILMRIDIGRSIEVDQYDYETGRLKESGGNPEIVSQDHPLLVRSANALNAKRVLWLRDSFGMALAPYMAATFAETLQVHYNVTDARHFAHLVDSFKPDYVFVTVVERMARDEFFLNGPP